MQRSQWGESLYPIRINLKNEYGFNRCSSSLYRNQAEDISKPFIPLPLTWFRYDSPLLSESTQPAFAPLVDTNDNQKNYNSPAVNCKDWLGILSQYKVHSLCIFTNRI